MSASETLKTESQLETILVAVSEQDERRIDAVASAIIEAAAPADSEVILAHVFSKERYNDLSTKLGKERGVPSDSIAKRQTVIRELQSKLSEHDITTTIKTRIDDNGTGIVELANRSDADRVLVGGRKRSPSGKAVFGSTAQTVLMNAPCPVTFVRSDGD